MKENKYWRQAAAGLILAVLVMWIRGGQMIETKEILLAASDGLCITALLYICIGALRIVSATGAFDIFSFALRAGACMLVPGFGFCREEGYYEYKKRLMEKRKRPYGGYALILMGGVLLGLAFLATGAWYAVS